MSGVMGRELRPHLGRGALVWVMNLRLVWHITVFGEGHGVLVYLGM